MMLTAWRRPDAARNDIRQLLFVEPVRRIVELMRDDLEMAGFDITRAKDGASALEIATGGDFDVVVLDSVLPGRDAMVTLRRLRALELPVVWLTRCLDTCGRKAGEAEGAASVLAMPFGAAELVQCARRATRATTTLRDDLTFGALRLFADQKRVEVGGNPVRLSRSELALLRALVYEPGRLIRREVALRAIASVDYTISARAVDTVFMSLCHKLGACGRYFETVWGAGYRFIKPRV